MLVPTLAFASMYATTRERMLQTNKIEGASQYSSKKSPF